MYFVLESLSVSGLSALNALIGLNLESESRRSNLFYKETGVKYYHTDL